MKTTRAALPLILLGLLSTFALKAYPPYPYPFPHEPSSSKTETVPQSAAGEAVRTTFVETALVDLDIPPEFYPTNDAATPNAFSAAAATAGASDPGRGTAASLLGTEISNGSFDADGVKGDITTFRIPYAYKLQPRATLQLTIPLSVTNFDAGSIGTAKDAQAYGAGLNVGLAWQRYLKTDNVPYRWKITPTAGIFYRDSSDLRMGALVFNVGLSSSFAYQFMPGWIINLGNSFSNAWNTGIKDYPDPVRDDQQSVANGLQLIHLAGRLGYHVYVAHTHQLNRDVLVDDYVSVGAGVGFKLTPSRSLKFSVVTENGNAGYNSTRATLGTTWNF